MVNYYNNLGGVGGGGGGGGVGGASVLPTIANTNAQPERGLLALFLSTWGHAVNFEI